MLRKLGRVADTETAETEQLTLEEAGDEAARLTTRILELRDAYYERDEVLVDDAE